MFDRKKLKSNAKMAIKKNYWMCVLAGFILMLMNFFSNNGYNQKIIQFVSKEILSIIPFVTVLSILLGIFVSSALEVGGCRFFTKNIYENPGFRELMYYFGSPYYLNIVKIIFFREVKIFLWTLLFIIPGIIKYYEYYMVPYLLAEHPELSSARAFKLSKMMMNGYKADTFILELSFIGWALLSLITAGMVGIFWLNPYTYATKAELYYELKQIHNIDESAFISDTFNNAY